MTYTKLTCSIFALLIGMAQPNLVQASGDDHHQHEETEAKGPNGGKLLTDDDFAVEVTIYNSGIPPEMRVFVYQNDTLVDPKNVDLHVTLHRLGDVNDELTFTTDGDYLVSNEVVTEPHSYGVSVQASSGNAQAEWHYESFEGRTTLSDRVIEKARIEVEPATKQTLKFKDRLFGVIAPVRDQHFAVKAQYRGEVSEVNVNIGDRVAKGQTLATIINAASGARYNVHSPISGEVTDRFINPGELADNQTLFEIADLSKVWVELSAFPENIEKIKLGQTAEVFDLHHHERTNGEVIYISPVMTGGHIARARVLVSNDDGHWRPGMHVQADINTDEKEVPLAVKVDAIQTFRDKPVVFAKYGNAFEVRMVELGASDGDYIEVTSGLEPNTPYVIGNSYLLKADVLKDGASHDH